MGDPHIVSFWIDKVKIGAVLGTCSGPPCDTWTIAKIAALTDPGDHEPRPLRDAFNLWGRTDLNKADREKVEMASAHLRTSIMFLAAAAAFGSVAIMEHPIDAVNDPTAAAVWWWEEIKYMRELPMIDVTLIHQCAFGAPFMKPTHLASVNSPVRQIARAWSSRGLCNGFHQHQELSGKDEHGHYRTRAAKEYPGPMCTMIAIAMLKGILSRRCFRRGNMMDLLFDLPHPETKFYMPLDRYLEAHFTGQVGNDFHRS